MKKSKVFLILASILFVISLALISVGIAWPFIMNNLVVSKAKEWSQLTYQNFAKWSQRPGPLNITTTNSMYLYDFYNHK